jgi:ubiquinone/menaquinone biosynthesis C-methylase UbiE
MRRPLFIARQAAKPVGLIGRLIGAIMAYETATINKHAVDLLALRPSDRVLEIGFGHGRTVERIASVVTQGHVAGLDVSQTMTRSAIRRNHKAVIEGRVDLRTGTCASMPYADGQFDKVLTVHTIYFWNEPQECLREIRRIMRAGARLVLGCTGSGASCTTRFPAAVYRFYDDGQIRWMLASEGFAIHELKRVGEAILVIATS